MKNRNPFLFSNNFTPAKIFGRKKETKLAIVKLRENENLVILAPDGTGKTKLIENIIYQLGKKQKVHTYYFDLNLISNMNNFLIQFIGKIAKEMDYPLSLNGNATENLAADEIYEKINDYSETKLFKIFNELLEEMNSSKIASVIAFNNIQAADKFSADKFSADTFERKVLNPLLIRINISSILAGTNNPFKSKHLYEIRLPRLSEKTLQKYIVDGFNSAVKKIEQKEVKNIITWADYDIHLINLLCSKLWLQDKNRIKRSLVNLSISQLVSEGERLFFQIKKLLSSYQWKLLESIAVDKDPIQITSAGFIEKYELNAPSSVKTAIVALQEKGMVYKDNKTYKLSNPLISHWIRYNFKN